MSAAVFGLLLNILSLYTFIIFAWVVASWLISFGIVNTRNPLMYNIVKGLNALVNPVIRPIQKVIPPIGGLDLSPIILLFALYFIRDFLISFYQSGSIL